MIVTLETVRNVLKEALGFNSFVAGFIKSIHQDDTIPTACIRKDGVLIVNPQFVNRYIESQPDLFCLVFHEILHPLFGHFIYKTGQLENIAADAIINAAISQLYQNHSQQGHLFTKLYQSTDLEGLLRPSSTMEHGRYHCVYDQLYSPGWHCDSLTTGELIQTLKILTPGDQSDNILLLGTHGFGQSPDSVSIDPFDHDDLASIALDIQSSLNRQKSKFPGHGSMLLDLIMEALTTRISIKRALLSRFTTKQKVDRFKITSQSLRLTTSPFPVNPSKRDLVLLSAGIYPFHFHNRIITQKHRHEGLAVYLDVSSSVEDYLPKIIGILKQFQNEIDSIFLFSNEVVEISFHHLLKGEITTTCGTDFNCIAESILKRGFKKAIIITDGYAWMSENLKQKLEEKKLSTLTILFDSNQNCEAFAPFGDVVQLNDVCL